MLVSFFFFAFMTKVYDREVTSILNQSLSLMKKHGVSLIGWQLPGFISVKTGKYHFHNYNMKIFQWNFGIPHFLPTNSDPEINQQYKRAFLNIHFTKRTPSSIIFLSKPENVFENVPFLGSRSSQKTLSLVRGPSSSKPVLTDRIF